MTHPSEPPPVSQPDPAVPAYAASPARSSGFRLIQLIWFLAGLVDVLVGMRFVLKLLGASTQSSFVSLLYGITSPLITPFRFIFPTAGQGPFVFEPESLVALVVYPLIALGLVSLIRILDRRQTLAA